MYEATIRFFVRYLDLHLRSVLRLERSYSFFLRRCCDYPADNRRKRPSIIPRVVASYASERYTFGTRVRFFVG